MLSKLHRYSIIEVLEVRKFLDFQTVISIVVG